jgi:transposase InsO family protein
LGQPRSTQRRTLVARDDEDALTQAIVELASEYGRYGYRRITALLRHQGWHVNHKRVERIWHRRRPQHRHHVWSYDFVMERTHDGRAFRMLTVIDEFSRECLAIRTERRQNQETVLETLAELFLLHGPPDHIRSDNSAEFTATAVREWLHRLEVQTLFIEPGSPWERASWSSNGEFTTTPSDHTAR